MEQTHRPVIIGIGELLWDMLPSGKRAGGAPVNFVYHATQLGAEGYAISAVGNDALGDEIIEELKRSGIKYSITWNNYPTGHVNVILNKGIPTYEIVENVAWDHLQITPESLDLVEKADAVCFGTLALRSLDSRKTIETLLEHVPQKALRFFDINLRGTYYSKELIEELLKKANVFKMNDEEITVIRQLFNFGGDDDDLCREMIKRYHLDYMIFTAGEKYSIIYTEREKSYLPTPKVDVADTVGAGDSFSGAFVYSILTGKSLHEAHLSAVRTAAFVSTGSGAWPLYEQESKHD